MWRFCTTSLLSRKIQLYKPRFNSETTHFASHFMSTSTRERVGALKAEKFPTGSFEQLLPVHRGHLWRKKPCWRRRSGFGCQVTLIPGFERKPSNQQLITLGPWKKVAFEYRSPTWLGERLELRPCPTARPERRRGRWRRLVPLEVRGAAERYLSLCPGLSVNTTADRH